MTSFTSWCVRRAGWIAGVSLLLAFISAFFTGALYKNLRPDLEELLPKSARSVVDLEQATGRLASASSLGVLVFSSHPAESKNFVDDLARAIQALHSAQVSRVEYRITQELQFFSRRSALFIDVPDLKRIQIFLKNRIDYEKELHNPLNIFGGRALAPPRLDFKTLEGKYSARLSAYTKFKDGYYANRDQTVRVLLVHLSGKASGLAQAKKLRADVDAVVARLSPTTYAPDLTVKYTGDVENLIEENTSLFADLEKSAVIVLFFVTLAMIGFYRNWAATGALVSSLLCGTLVTFGLAYFTVGYLNASTAFLGSIVAGNGINFGIIILARYLEERRGGLAHDEALHLSLSQTLTSTLTAALAAGLSYGSLLLTSFRGFRQFGIIGMFGMVLCWISAFVTMPAFLTLADRWQRRRGPFVFKPNRHRFAHGLAKLIQVAPRAILAASAVLLIFCALAVFRHSGSILETDTSRLRDKESMTRGSGYLSKYLDEVFERYTSPVVILPSSVQDSREIARRLEARRKQEGARSLIASVYSMQDLVPSHQREKIGILLEIKALLSARVLRSLSARDSARVAQFLQPEVFHLFSALNLPFQVRERFREKDGSIGRPVLVDPVFDERILNEGGNQAVFVTALRETADAVRPGTPVVGQLPLTVDMWQSVRRDGPRATLVAFLAVLLLGVVLFRQLKTIALMLSSLLLGVAWLAGAIFHWQLTINFLNFIALPITFGIGVDYGVNIMQRYRLEGRGSILRVLRGTAGAVALASLTTIIGYGSLLLAGNQGFVSFGRIAILGEFTCLTAAIVSLPAYLEYRDRKTAGLEAHETERLARAEQSRAA